VVALLIFLAAASGKSADGFLLIDCLGGQFASMA
jgi:hypothetical protein